MPPLRSRMIGRSPFATRPSRPPLGSRIARRVARRIEISLPSALWISRTTLDRSVNFVFPRVSSRVCSCGFVCLSWTSRIHAGEAIATARLWDETGTVRERRSTVRCDATRIPQCHHRRTPRCPTVHTTPLFPSPRALPRAVASARRLGVVSASFSCTAISLHVQSVCPGVRCCLSSLPPRRAHSVPRCASAAQQPWHHCSDTTHRETTTTRSANDATDTRRTAELGSASLCLTQPLTISSSSPVCVPSFRSCSLVPCRLPCLIRCGSVWPTPLASRSSTICAR